MPSVRPRANWFASEGCAATTTGCTFELEKSKYQQFTQNSVIPVFYVAIYVWLAYYKNSLRGKNMSGENRFHRIVFFLQL